MKPVCISAFTLYSHSYYVSVFHTNVSTHPESSEIAPRSFKITINLNNFRIHSADSILIIHKLASRVSQNIKSNVSLGMLIILETLGDPVYNIFHAQLTHFQIYRHSAFYCENALIGRVHSGLLMLMSEYKLHYNSADIPPFSFIL